MRVTVKGQVTIPNVLRIKYHLLPHAEVEFKEKNGMLCLVRAKYGKKESRGEQLIRRMRSAKVDRSMTTAEIMELTRGYKIDDK